MAFPSFILILFLLSFEINSLSLSFEEFRPKARNFLGHSRLTMYRYATKSLELEQRLCCIKRLLTWLPNPRMKNAVIWKLPIFFYCAHVMGIQNLFKLILRNILIFKTYPINLEVNKDRLNQSGIWSS